MEDLLTKGGNIGFAGYNAMKGANCMRQQAAYMVKLAQQYKQQWNALLTAEGEEAKILNDGMIMIVNNMSIVKDQMLLGKAVHKKYMKQIQMIGIIFITVIFFLLLLKTFGLLSPLGQALIWPFKAPFQALGSKGKHTKTNVHTTTLSH